MIWNRETIPEITKAESFGPKGAELEVDSYASVSIRPEANSLLSHPQTPVSPHKERVWCHLYVSPSFGFSTVLTRGLFRREETQKYKIWSELSARDRQEPPPHFASVTPIAGRQKQSFWLS